MAKVRFVRFVLLLVPFLACKGPPQRAEEARAAGDHLLAAEHYGRAAVEAICPERGQYLLLRADMQELAGRGAAAAESVEKAVQHCPDLAEAWWVRAQRRKEAGDRQGAMEDAAHVKDVIPEALAVYNELAMEVEVERSVRQQAATVVEALRRDFVSDAPDEPLRDLGPAVLARQVPVPLTVRYAIRNDVTRPAPYSLTWIESWSYRDEEAGSFDLVRAVELPPLEHTLPLPVRLLMSNQRMPMRFTVDPRGQILLADWVKDGPDRGMRPEMLRPEVQGALRRRRLFDPGEQGQRVLGESWQGEEVRVLDGQPRSLTYSSRAEGWVRVRGLKALRVVSTLSGPSYRATEERHVHPESALVLRETLVEDFTTSDERGTETTARRRRSEVIAFSASE